MAGDRARARLRRDVGIVDHASESASSSAAILATSCDVREPSKNGRTGMREASAARAPPARDPAFLHRAGREDAPPGPATAITSLWSPDRERVRGQGPGRHVQDAGQQFARDLVHVGNHQSRPWLAVSSGKAPAARAWSAPAAPPCSASRQRGNRAPGGSGAGRHPASASSPMWTKGEG